MRRLSRRSFLETSALAGAAVAAPLVLPSRVFGQDAPSNRINVAVIGVSAQGRGHFNTALGYKDLQVVAVCDVHKARVDHYCETADAKYAAQRTAGTYKGCRGFGDYRQLLAMADLDAVIIAVPDHWHGLITVAACRAGKDVYAEKPLALTHFESRAIADAAKQYGTAFQTGSQQRSDPNFRFACELVRNGAIGKVQEAWINIGTPPQPFCDLPPEPVPAGLDWEFWLGPSQWRPYNKGLCPDGFDAGFGGWRGFGEFGGGGQADFGAHHYDIAQWGLDAERTGPVEVVPPDGKDVAQLTYTYADGVRMKVGTKVKGDAVTFVGEKGQVSVNRGGFLQTDPAGLADVRFGPNDVRLYESKNHVQNWVDCMKSRRETIAPAEVGHRSAAVCQIGNIAYRLGRPLKWDPAAERFTGDDEANRLLRREMRGPWVL